MRNDHHARADIDYAAYLARVGCSTVEEAFENLDPRENTSDNDTPGDCAESVQSTDYFVFHQAHGRWAWQRLGEAEAVVEVSNGSFRYYLHCIADAKKHGWQGKPLSFFCASGFERRG